MKSRKRSRASRRGSTLIEALIASAMLVMIGSTALLVSETATRSFRTETQASELEIAARTALGKIAALLRSANAAAILPPAVAAPQSLSQFDFRRSTGYDDVLDMVKWGDPERLTFEYDPGDPDDGVDNDGDGLIDEGRIVHIDNPDSADERRVVLCNWVSESLEGEIPGNLLDENGNGLVSEAGFCVVFDGSRATVRLTLERLDKYGNRICQTYERSIAMRNTKNP